MKKKSQFMKSLYLRKQKALLFRRRLLRNLTVEDFASNAVLVMAAGDAENKMQEVFKNGSEGEVHVENKIEDLIPHIKKSLKNPDVKYVKVFRGKTLSAGLRAKVEIKFTAEEEKKNIMDEINSEGKKL